MMEGTPEGNATPFFTVTLNAPEALQWDDLVAPALEALARAGVSERERGSVIRHYAYLLRLNSWKHGIDWNPTQGKITVVVPNAHASRQVTEESGLLRDGLTAILKQVFGGVSLQEVLRHFEDQYETELR